MTDLVNRPRRLRANQLIRDMVAETSLKVSSMIQPYFVCEGKNVKLEISSMPGIFRESPDSLVKSIAKDFELGIKRVMLFGVPETKDAQASSALGEKSVVNVATSMLKDKYGDDLFISADVCLCGYTKSGHCGLVSGDKIDNDSTLPVLTQMAIDLARAGCDCVGPSDMMDGRIGEIRDGLDDSGFTDTIIMAYSAKYASAYYGPFRDAAESAPQHGDRQSYQMDFRNRREAFKEVALDVEQGADIVMVKPALAYLDVISDVKTAFELPVAAYNVSGEYAMVKLMAQQGYADEKKLTLENLYSISRAGADIILTYHLRDILRHGWLK
ncbi:MAG: porphobilinogen synthase [candidate division Zixibacteria bacterium]|nr:porphobilinogen synthase [candidate division Zixibacteria bacterium]MBU1471004.1 porphobilinogen synthase [candidate division Zixibacteria bacterium]MBU2623930.1 porphobilinogen synthase [candidate division Zixibacteria bacterium]